MLIFLIVIFILFILVVVIQDQVGFCMGSYVYLFLLYVRINLRSCNFTWDLNFVVIILLFRFVAI